MTQEAGDKRPKDLMGCLQGIEDPRVERTREHKLSDILIIGICCVICYQRRREHVAGVAG